MPSPKSLLLLNSLSLCLAILTLLFSLLDLGILSLWMDPAASILTIIYHSTLLFMSHNRPGPESSIMHSVLAIAIAYLLSVIWLGAFAVMVIIAYGNESGEINVFNFNIQFPTAIQNTQQLQFLLAPTEFSLLGDIAIRSTIQRRKLNALKYYNIDT